METSYGATQLGQGVNGETWNVLGQTYIPLHVTKSSLLIHVEMTPGSFVPTHIHETQDEFIYILDGTMDCELDGETITASPGTDVALPMRIPHALFNRSNAPVKALVFVSPTGKMFDYMRKINGLPDPAEVIRIGADHEVTFT